MSPVTHGLLSWLLAESVPLDRRGRLAVTLAGVAPDLDGFGWPVQVLSRDALPWFELYHHRILHNGLGALGIAVACWLWCRRDWRVGLLALAAAHLHFLCDLLGSRGPDGYDWPIPYLLPFSQLELRWSGQWALNAWPNVAITVAALAVSVWLAVRRGRSPAELVSLRADAAVVSRLRRWSGTAPPA